MAYKMSLQHQLYSRLIIYDHIVSLDELHYARIFHF